MDEKKRMEIYKQLIKRHGRLAQVGKVAEECAELIQAIVKYCLNVMDGLPTEHEYDHIAEEVADVEITLEQLKLIFDNQALVEEWKKDKLNRTKERLRK